MASNVLSFAAPGSSGTVGPTGIDVTYYGFSLRETAGSTAVVRIRAGGVVGGTILDTISLAANESAREDYFPQGLRAAGGLYYQLVSGAVEGAIRVG